MKMKYPGSQFFVICAFDNASAVKQYRDANTSLIFLTDYPSAKTWYDYKYDNYVPLNCTLTKKLNISWTGHNSDFNTMKTKFEDAANSP